MPSRKMHRSRKNTRKTRNARKMRKHSRKHRGGMAPVSDSSMVMPQQNSLGQGSDYLRMHKGQYGGAAAYPSSFGATLPASMVAAARTGPLDSAIGAIQGMQDGGALLRKVRKSRKSKKSKKSKKHSRRHRGGYRGLMGASLSEGSMLLPPGAERQAALSHEWGLAKDPSSFSPKP